jgi:hypothetical protein
MPRRKRFRIEYLEEMGERLSLDILSYSEERAVEYVESQGGHVLSVNAPRPPTWELDETALDEAKKLLGLRWPVKIGRTTSRDHHGAHYLHLARRSPVHCIVADKVASVAESSRVLWHELCHAMQAERNAAGLSHPKDQHEAWGLTLACERGRPIAEQPLEVEASSYENAAAYMPLTKAVKP